MNNDTSLLIDTFLINNKISSYPFESLELINKEYILTLKLLKPISIKSLSIKFQRGFHPQKLKWKISSDIKNIVTNSIYLKSDTDSIYLDLSKYNLIKDIELFIETTYDHFNRLVIYDMSIL